MIKIEQYYKICNQKQLIQNKTFEKSIAPKISIITPIYNRETTLKRYLRSIQNQAFNDLEIILINDLSEDNTSQEIELLKKEDERIILIQNKQRRGTLKSRNIGVLKSKGEFLLFVDPDDLISENILNFCYIMAKRFDYDLIRYNLYMGNYLLNSPDIVNNIKNKPIYKTNIFSFLFYGFGRLFQLDYFITNKLIKRNLYIKALNSINKYYLEQFMIDCEDGLINFMLYKLGDSLYFTKKIGYFYIKTNTSITHESIDFKNRLKSNFLYFRFVFQMTKNNNIEKNIANYIFSEIYNFREKTIIKLFQNLSTDYSFYLETINLYLGNDFIPLNSKRILKNLKNVILSRESSIQ